MQRITPFLHARQRFLDGLFPFDAPRLPVIRTGPIVADRIAVPQPRSAKQHKASPPSGQPQPPPKTTNELHAHSTITSIDPQVKTVTIEDKDGRTGTKPESAGAGTRETPSLSVIAIGTESRLEVE
jgi:NADPH-dependent 2,4-dienoyl-CoA reductase/sulfur reductase-like enzyme